MAEWRSDRWLWRSWRRHELVVLSRSLTDSGSDAEPPLTVANSSAVSCLLSAPALLVPPAPFPAVPPSTVQFDDPWPSTLFETRQVGRPATASGYLDDDWRFQGDEWVVKAGKLTTRKSKATKRVTGGGASFQDAHSGTSVIDAVHSLGTSATQVPYCTLLALPALRTPNMKFTCPCHLIRNQRQSHSRIRYHRLLLLQ